MCCVVLTQPCSWPQAYGVWDALVVLWRTWCRIIDSWGMSGTVPLNWSKIAWSSHDGEAGCSKLLVFVLHMLSHKTEYRISQPQPSETNPLCNKRFFGNRNEQIMKILACCLNYLCRINSSEEIRCDVSLFTMIYYSQRTFVWVMSLISHNFLVRESECTIFGQKKPVKMWPHDIWVFH